MINKKTLKKLEPCENRFENYLSHYDDFEGSLKQFLNLKKINFEDKKWVYFRSIDKEKTIQVAISLSEACLPIFEKEHPLDKRPRLAVEAAKTGKVAKEILDCAWAAYAARAVYYAATAAYAASYAANAAYYTATAAYYAANADYADYAAASAAAYAAKAIGEEAVFKIMKEFV